MLLRSKSLKLPEGLRDKLKEPLGILIPNDHTSKENILSKIPKGHTVITVGDATSEKLMGFGMVPHLQIVDGLEKRKKREIPDTESKVLYCENPPAQITQQSVDTIEKALSMGVPTRILVSGEEDLLVIPACILAPEKSVVLYGQPNEGLVLVLVDQEIRNKSRDILNQMISGV